MDRVLKLFRGVFGRRRRSRALSRVVRECQAILTDSDKISRSAKEMRKSNNDILCVYECTHEDFDGLRDQLQKSEEMVNQMAEKFTEMESMVERACDILSEEKEQIQRKRETLERLREDVEDSKCRIACVRETSLAAHGRSPGRTPSGMMSSVREEREDLEHRSRQADMAIRTYTEENLEDELVIPTVQHIRQRLQKDHESHVLQLQNECANFEKKSAVLMFQKKHLNTLEGKTELLSNFRVPKEEQEFTRKRFESIKKRKEALLERIQGQKGKKRSLRDYNARLRESIKKKMAKLG